MKTKNTLYFWNAYSDYVKLEFISTNFLKHTQKINFRFFVGLAHPPFSTHKILLMENENTDLDLDACFSTLVYKIPSKIKWYIR